MATAHRHMDGRMAYGEKPHRKGLGEQHLLSQHLFAGQQHRSNPTVEQDRTAIYVIQNSEQNDTTFPMRVEHCPRL